MPHICDPALKNGLTHVTAGQCLADGSNDLVTNDLANDLEMFGCQGMLVHQCVHRWEYIGRGGGSERAQERCLHKGRY